MNDVIFNTTEYMGDISLILLAFLVIAIVASMYIMPKLSKRYDRLFFVVSVIVSIVLFVIGVNMPKKAESSSFVYAKTNFTNSYALNLDDFNKVMQEKYDYKFAEQNNSSKKDEPYYIATNLKTNKKAYHCYLDFEKVNNDKHQVKLVNVSCGNSIMQDIMKNKQK